MTHGRVNRHDLTPIVDRLCEVLGIKPDDLLAIDINPNTLTADIVARDPATGRPYLDHASKQLAQVLAVWDVVDDEQQP